MKNPEHRPASRPGAGFVIRSCDPGDLPAVAGLAARLVREHHAMDSQRFLIFDHIEEGYEAYLRGEMQEDRSVVLVAAMGERVVGYAYGRVEPKDWNMLRESCGALHDVYVDESARRRGVASALIREMILRLGKLGVPRVVLMTAIRNESARAVFQRLGFRPTMLEMTRECPRSS